MDWNWGSVEEWLSLWPHYHAAPSCRKRLCWCFEFKLFLFTNFTFWVILNKHGVPVRGNHTSFTGQCGLEQPCNPQNDLLPLTCCVLNSRTSWVIVTGKNEANQHTWVTSRGASDCSFIIKLTLTKHLNWTHTHKLKSTHTGVTLIMYQYCGWQQIVEVVLQDTTWTRPTSHLYVFIRMAIKLYSTRLTAS